MAHFIFDCHAHFSFKPANSSNFETGEEPDPDHWRERFRRKEDFSGFSHFADKTVIKSSQLHGDSCTLSGHRIVINGLYPLERGFISGLFLKALATLTGYSRDSLRLLHHRDRSYFDIMERAYNNLLTHNGDPAFSTAGNRYRMVKSYSELMSNLRLHPDDINLVQSVEGAHCFAENIRDEQDLPVDMLAAEKRHIRSLINQGSGDEHFKAHLTALINNIEDVKANWEYIPFFVGIAHHYYNHIAGHSPSLTGLVDFIANQDGASIDFSGRILNFYYIGIRRGWGYAVVNKLLSRKKADGTKTRRILIDIKHMSPQARVDYYKLLDVMLQQDPTECIPIVASHIAVSGRMNLQETINREHEKTREEGTRGKYFYDGIINLFDDEIQRIVDSDGIIGMMIDERRIMGRFVPPESGFDSKGDFNKVAKQSRRALTKIVKCKHRITWLLEELQDNPGDPDIQEKLLELRNELSEQRQIQEETTLKLRPAYLSVVMRQIFHILDITGEKGWDHICLGSDYDGVINPIDIYAQSQDMSTIRDDFIDFWNDIINNGSAEVRSLYTRHLYGRSPAHWINKFILFNGLNFLKKYFTDDYLREGILPVEGYVLTRDEEDELVG